MVLFGGLYQILNVYSNRKKKYQLLAVSKVTKSGSTVVTNLGISYLLKGPTGLVFGSITGQFLSFFVLLRSFLKEELPDLRKVTFRNLLKQAKEYRKFPLLDIPSTLMNKSLNDALVIEINRVFVDVVSGYYVLMRRILAMPISFFVMSFSDVFYQKLSENQDVKVMSTQIKEFLKKLILYFVGPYFLFVYTSPLYVGFIFGDNWAELYKYIYIYSPLFFLNIVLSPFRNVLRITNRQEVGLALNFMKFLAIVGVFYLFVVENNNLLGFLALSLVQSLTGLANAQIIYWKLIKELNNYLTGLTVFTIVLYLINYYLLF
jgi:O-antigen/teichoic acid export membrane protein